MVYDFDDKKMSGEIIFRPNRIQLVNRLSVQFRTYHYSAQCSITISSRIFQHIHHIISVKCVQLITQRSHHETGVRNRPVIEERVQHLPSPHIAEINRLVGSTGHQLCAPLDEDHIQ